MKLLMMIWPRLYVLCVGPDQYFSIWNICISYFIYHISSPFCIQLRYGPFVHCLLYLTKRNHRYRVSHLDFALAYITIWPVIAVIVDTAKFMFGELRPNFIARCFFNGSTGVSKTLSAEELISFDFDINDCPG